MKQLFSLVFVFLIIHQCLFADEFPLKGRVDYVDETKREFTIRHEGIEGYMEKPGIVQVGMSAGDYAIYDVGDEIEATLYTYKDEVRLKTVWPAEAEVRERMEDINQDLHRNTMMRGRQVKRRVGDTLPPFALYNQLGDLVTLDDLRGKPVVMNFIFTRCRMPNMCPAATTRMAQLQRAMIASGYKDGYQLISITLDPAYDTPGVFFDYAEMRGIHHSTFFFLGGSEDAVKDLKKQIGVIAVEDEKNIINHTMATVVTDSEGTIIYRVPGTKWSVEDIYKRLKVEVDKVASQEEPKEQTD